MNKSNPLSDFVQFIIGGCFFAAGVFLLSNQVMVRAPMAIGGAVRSGYGRGWGSGFAFPWGSPGMGLLLLPLGIGLCMAFAGAYERWSKLLIWASLCASAGSAEQRENVVHPNNALAARGLHRDDCDWWWIDV